MVRRRGGRKRALGTRAPMELPHTINQRWSLDFVSGTLADRRRFRISCVVDDFSRECLAMVVDASLSGVRVVRELDQLLLERATPAMIVSDNGTELTRRCEATVGRATIGGEQPPDVPGPAAQVPWRLVEIGRRPTKPSQTDTTSKRSICIPGADSVGPLQPIVLQFTEYCCRIPIIIFFVVKRTESPFVIFIRQVGSRQFQIAQIVHLRREPGITIVQYKSDRFKGNTV